MANPEFEEIVADFEFLDDWEDRYRMVIELGKAMEPLPEALKVPATKVEGCASQVWLHPQIDSGTVQFDGESAVLRKLYNGLPPSDVAAIDARAELGRLGLTDHLSAQRSNGLRAMIQRLQGFAAASS